MRARLAIIASAGPLLGGLGCETSYPSLTCGLLTGNSFRTFNEPATTPQLAVYQSRQPPDLLVTYPAPCSEAVRALMTRLALIADTAIAATVVGISAAAGIARSGVTVSP